MPGVTLKPAYSCKNRVGVNKSESKDSKAEALEVLNFPKKDGVSDEGGREKEAR